MHLHYRTQILRGGGWVVWALGGGSRASLTTVTLSQMGTRLWGTGSYPGQWVQAKWGTCTG